MYINFTTATSITKIKQQAVMDGSILYKITLEDVPLEAVDFHSLRDAMEQRVCVCLDVYEAK